MPLPPRVLAAFAAAGVEPPDVERVDRMGYTFAETKIIDRGYGIEDDAPVVGWNPALTQVRGT